MIEFEPRPGGVRVRLSTADVGVLGRIPALLDTLGDPADDPAAARLAPGAYPDDAAADAEFRRLADTELARGRSDDRAGLLESLAPGDVDLDAEQAAAWLRVINETRLLLAARLGIEDDGWSYRRLGRSSRAALLYYLSWAQESLLAALEPGLEAEPEPWTG